MIRRDRRLGNQTGRKRHKRTNNPVPEYRALPEPPRRGLEGAGGFLKAISQKKFHWVSQRFNI
jgi:hypothetical protein